MMGGDWGADGQIDRLSEHMWRRFEGAIAILVAFILAAGVASTIHLLSSAHPRQQWKTNEHSSARDAKCKSLDSLFGIKAGQKEDSKTGTVEQHRYVELCQQIRSAVAAEDAADYALWQLRLGLGGVFLAGIAAIAAGYAARFTWQQADAAKTQLAHVLQPRLKLNNVVIVKNKGDFRHSRMFEPGDKIDVWAFAINTGGRTAKIKFNTAEIRYWKSLPISKQMPIARNCSPLCVGLTQVCCIDLVVSG